MERINELGVNPAYIYNPSFDGQFDQRDKGKLDKANLLKLLGPSVTEKYSDLIASISENTSRTQDFIEKVNSNIDIYA